METTESACRRLIRKVRDARGMNQTDLAREVTKLGLPMRQTTVSKIEDGTRKIGVDELMAIAAALDVPPPVLLIPFDSEDDYAVAPGTSHYPWYVYEWFKGTHSLMRKPEIWTALDYYSEVRKAQLRLRELQLERARLDDLTDDPGTLAKLEQRHDRQWQEALQDLLDAIGDMKEAGYPCDRLVAEPFAKEMKKRKMKPRTLRERLHGEGTL